MLVINTSINPVQVRLYSSSGELDYIHVMGRSRADVPDGFTVDKAWAASNASVKLITPEVPPSKITLQKREATQPKEMNNDTDSTPRV